MLKSILLTFLHTNSLEKAIDYISIESYDSDIIKAKNLLKAKKLGFTKPDPTTNFFISKIIIIFIKL